MLHRGGEMGPLRTGLLHMQQEITCEGGRSARCNKLRGLVGLGIAAQPTSPSAICPDLAYR